jgi:hypothetical protein
VAPFEYSSLLFAAVLGYSIWGQAPDRHDQDSAQPDEGPATISGAWRLRRRRVSACLPPTHRLPVEDVEPARN